MYMYSKNFIEKAEELSFQIVELYKESSKEESTALRIAVEELLKTAWQSLDNACLVAEKLYDKPF